MGHHGAVAGAVRHLHRFQGLGQGADLVDLDQDGVGDALVDAGLEALGIGDEEVVADQLRLVAGLPRQLGPAVPVVLGHAVLDGDDGIALDQLGQFAGHLRGAQHPPLARQVVLAVLEELRGGAVQRQRHLLARLVAGGLDGAENGVQSLGGRAQVRREAAFVADVGVVPGRLQLGPERMEHLGAGAQALREAAGAPGHDHELLKVDGIVGVGPAVDDVHEGHRQGPREAAADVAVERQAALLRGRLGQGERHPQQGVGAQTLLVLRAVQLDQGAVDGHLILGLQAGEHVEDLVIDRLDGLQHPLAAVTGRVAVAQLDRLVRARRGAGGNGSAAEGPAFQRDVDLHRGIAAGIQDLAGTNVDDGGHGRSCQVRVCAEIGGCE